MNAVCMGLAVIQTEIASNLGYSSPEALQESLDENTGPPGESPKPRISQSNDQVTHMEWFQLTKEVHESAIAATNGMFYLHHQVVNCYIFEYLSSLTRFLRIKQYCLISSTMTKLKTENFNWS